MTIGFYLLHLIMQIESGAAVRSTYLLFGFALAMEYLCRAAFATFVPIYLMVGSALLWLQSASLKPILFSVLTAAITAGPFVAALSISKGHFTIGEAGKLNYGWEVAGAARTSHWQGEPYDIGRPVHPTHKVLDSPATYVFVDPVPVHTHCGMSPLIGMRASSPV